MIPEILSTTKPHIVKYTRFGQGMVTALSPMYISWFNRTSGMRVDTKFAIFGLTISNTKLKSEITDDSQLLRDIIKWVLIFILFLVLILIMTLIMFLKIAKWALMPITLLNKKVKMLMRSNTAFDIETTKKHITSQEALAVYESISELMTARRFAQNHFFKLDDAIAIMEFAEAHTVLANNEKSKGICLTNIAHIYYKNLNYKKAHLNYEEAAA